MALYGICRKLGECAPSCGLCAKVDIPEYNAQPRYYRPRPRAKKPKVNLTQKYMERCEAVLDHYTMRDLDDILDPTERGLIYHVATGWSLKDVANLMRLNVKEACKNLDRGLKKAADSIQVGG